MEPALIQKMDAQLDYLSERQKLLAQNIANIDTPTYRAQDLKKLNFDDVVSSMSHHLDLKTTASGHIETAPGTRFDQIKDRKTVEKKPLGNNIVMEEQMGKISDVGAQHQLTSTLLKKYHQLYLTAVGNHS